VNLAHNNQAVIQSIQDQAANLAYAAPFSPLKHAHNSANCS
jgi:hypothetical protein